MKNKEKIVAMLEHKLLAKTILGAVLGFLLYIFGIIVYGFLDLLQAYVRIFDTAETLTPEFKMVFIYGIMYLTIKFGQLILYFVERCFDLLQDYSKRKEE